MKNQTENVVRLDSAQDALRRHFLGWQCRIRQHAVRNGGGQPSDGMRPAIGRKTGAAATRITTLITQREPAEATALFRHMARKTQDPKERLEAVLRTVSAAYYQHPEDFSDRMTALFGPDSGVADTLISAGACTLDFEQYGQRYRIPCAVGDLDEGDPAFQATYWHNILFNPNIPSGIKILSFSPDWATAEADPPPA